VRIALGTVATRLTILAGIVLGAFAATRHVTGHPIDAITSVACVAHLPGSAARCESDRFIAGTGPLVGPALVGAVVGLVAAVLVVALLRALLGGASRRPRPSR
jgi:hypothetical protein